ncbi:T9SS type A sorting domain-containing protein [Labilibacter sediminis]|nr:T9SS type A sorting domain-containing protein [Labilibacter sediminis]
MKKTFTLITIAIIGLLNLNAQNLLLNGSFENHDYDSDLKVFNSIDNWTFSNLSFVQRNQATPQEGLSSIYLKNNKKASVAQTITLLPNSRYQLSGWVKFTAGATGNAWMTAKDNSGNTLVSLSIMPGEEDLTSWTQKVGEFNTESETTISITLSRWQTGGVNPTGEFHMDNVELTYLGEATSTDNALEEQTSVIVSQNEIRLNFTGDEVRSATIYNMVGVQQYNRIITKGSAQEVINISQLQSGVHILVLKGENSSYSTKFIK